MKVLSFAPTEELFPAGVSCAVATPPRVNARAVRMKIQNCEITVILVFMALYGLKDAGTYRQSRIANRRLLGREGFAIS
jgi:hypothetical protein